MTKIKLCGLKRDCDIAYVNELTPEYIGFVFWQKSKRYVTPQNAALLRKQLNPQIVPVGVFVNEEPEVIADLVKQNVIEAVQLHGTENEEYLRTLRKYVNCPVIQAFQVKSETEIEKANTSSADYILLDSGVGSGERFDWSLLQRIERPYFLAGGLDSSNVKTAIQQLHPYAVDASSSLETDGYKDAAKMKAFVTAVREQN